MTGSVLCRTSDFVLLLCQTRGKTSCGRGLLFQQRKPPYSHKQGNSDTSADSKAKRKQCGMFGKKQTTEACQGGQGGKKDGLFSFQPELIIQYCLHKNAIVHAQGYDKRKRGSMEKINCRTCKTENKDFSRKVIIN